MRLGLQNILLFLFLALCSVHKTVSIQCYSCRASASNEVEANIQCLENAYLENCDDFYQYYNEVEQDQPLAPLDYYYYDDQDKYYDDEGYDTSKDDVDDEYSNKPRGRRRRRRQAATTESQTPIDQKDAGPNYDEYLYESNGEYDYTNMGEYEYPEGLSKILTPPTTTSRDSKQDMEEIQTDAESDIGIDELVASPDAPKLNLPKDPEHYCYSMTEKNKWESYTVEKGCKKISYCQDHYANLPEWGLPWNFCCDRSRCNAKQVKDKPQRIFGMGCRRTDDCIQGHVTRPVCPHMFKSCPSISPSLIKMECRAKTRPSQTALSRNPNLYFGQFQEKKCFCLPGHYPKGPICTSSAPCRLQTHITLLSAILMLNFTLRYVNRGPAIA